jgi:MATE family multidrug resistance protein
MTESSTGNLINTDKEASLKYMLRLAGPMVVTNISFTAMQFIDRFMVSRLGTAELAAILPAVMVSFIPSSLLLGIMTSVNTFVSQSLGRRQYSDCSNYCWQAINMGLVYTLLTLIILWPYAGWIFKTMGQPEAVINPEVIYFRIML